MNTIILVTSNDEKLKEVQYILGGSISRESLDLDEIQEMDLVKIVEHKAKQAYDTLHVPVMVEDVGLYFDAWGGFPGPFIKWLHTTMGYETMAKLLPLDNRKAQWIVVYGYYDGKVFQSFEGVTDGVIANKEKGLDGWGYDSLFIPNGDTRTFAEMGEDKYKFTPRKKALLKLKEYLETESK